MRARPSPFSADHIGFFVLRQRKTRVFLLATCVSHKTSKDGIPSPHMDHSLTGQRNRESMYTRRSVILCPLVSNISLPLEGRDGRGIYQQTPYFLSPIQSCPGQELTLRSLWPWSQFSFLIANIRIYMIAILLWYHVSRYSMANFWRCLLQGSTCPLQLVSRSRKCTREEQYR